MVGIDGHHRWDALVEVEVDGPALIQVHVEGVRYPGRALRHAVAAGVADVLVDIPGLARDLHVEAAVLTGHALDLAVGQKLYQGMPTGIQHLRRQDSYGAVVRRERLVQLRHDAADARALLDEMDLDAHLRKIERRLNPGDASAYD